MNYAKRMGQKTIGQKIRGKRYKKNLMKKKSLIVDRFYSEDQMERMPKMLSEYWAGNLDGDAIASILLMGNEGYELTDKEALLDEFETVFGENYFSQD